MLTMWSRRFWVRWNSSSSYSSTGSSSTQLMPSSTRCGICAQDSRITPNEGTQPLVIGMDRLGSSPTPEEWHGGAGHTSEDWHRDSRGHRVLRHWQHSWLHGHDACRELASFTAPAARAEM